MIEPYVVEGKTCVACARRLGSIKRTGPVTGKEYVIPINGEWIDEQDMGMVGLEEEVYCFRQQSMIKIVSIFFVEPNNRLLERLNGELQTQ